MQKINRPKSLAYQKSFSTVEAAYDYASALQKKTNFTFVVHPEVCDDEVIYVVSKLVDFNSHRLYLWV